MLDVAAARVAPHAQVGEGEDEGVGPLLGHRLEEVRLCVCVGGGLKCLIETWVVVVVGEQDASTLLLHPRMR